MRKSGRAVYLAIGVLVAATGCGSVSDNHPAPVLVPGGGIGGGAIDGYLNVYVIDADTNAPLTGAAVQVGASSASAPCMALTDSTGLVTFDPMSCPMLRGAVTVTASATGYAPSTWIGANGANMTINIQANVRPAPDTATVSGTIAGWESLPAPATGHTTIGLVAASQATNLGDLANNITQPTRTISVAGTALTTTIPANACVRNALADDCNWQLIARTGPQAHFAIIVDQDPNGTPNDSTDDIITPLGWALLTGLDLTKDATVNETLPQIAAADLVPFSATFPALPAGMTYFNAYPAIELPGGAGRIPAVVPTLGPNVTMTSVPKLGGTTTVGLAGGSYDLLASAQATMNAAEPASLTWMHGVSVAAPVAVSAWLPAPTGLAASGGQYSFVPVTGATLHSAEFKDPNGGGRTWSVTIFDGSTTFTLPGLSPNPLATSSGMDTLTVSALVIPGINLASVGFDDAAQKLTGLSTDQITVAP